MSKQKGNKHGHGKPGGQKNNPPELKKEVPSFEKGGVISDNITGQSGNGTLESIIPLDKIPGLMRGILDGKTDGIIEGDPETESRAISMERWQQAQKAERGFHNLSHAEGLVHYGMSYNHYFHFVGLGRDLHGLNVIEVGPADFPALNYCTNFGNAVVVEPMPSEILEQICKERGIVLMDHPFETLAPGSAGEGLTEVWLFNVMQHIIDPDKFIEVAKGCADRIRFFEPIDRAVELHHPHRYSLKDFQNWFGDSVQLYIGGKIEGFHEADCAYGVWIK